MIQLPIKVTDLKNLSEISAVLVFPLFVAAYTLQFGAFSNPAILNHESILTLACALLVNCTEVIFFGIILLGLFIWAAAWLEAHLELPVIAFIGTVFLSIGVTCIAAIHIKNVSIQANQFWFLGLIAAGFVLVQSSTKAHA